MPPLSGLPPAQALLRWSLESPRRTAVVDGDLIYSYGRFAEAVTKFAVALRASEVRREMLVGLQGQDRTITLALILGCEVLNATHATLSAAELAVEDPVARRCDVWWLSMLGIILRGRSSPASCDPVDRRAALACRQTVPERMDRTTRHTAHG